MNARSLILLLFLATAAHAQGAAGQDGAGRGYEGLGAAAPGFSEPQRGHVLHFPADHAAHPGFRIEWWYVTANLHDAAGHDYGTQWTLFRAARDPGPDKGWSSPVIWIAHAALTTARSHHWAERFARGGVGEAGAGGDPFTAWIDDWQMASPDAGISTLRLNASGKGFGYDLRLTATGPLVPEGDRGYSVKSREGQASYYYSQPFYRVRGTLDVGGRKIKVTGTAWLDREWSGQMISSGQVGWDWMGLSFDDGTRLMVAAYNGGGAPYNLGTFIAADGTPTALAPGDIHLDPGPGSPPTTWRVRVPRFGVDVTATALNPDAWTGGRFRYWEGPVRLTGSATGRGYLEMTGRGTPK